MFFSFECTVLVYLIVFDLYVGMDAFETFENLTISVNKDSFSHKCVDFSGSPLGGFSVNP